MSSQVFERFKRAGFGLMYLAVTAWAVWRTTALDSLDDNPLLTAMMCCVFAVTTAGAAAALLVPEGEEEAVPVPVEPEPVYEEEAGRFAYADPSFAPARLRGAGMQRSAGPWRPSNYAGRM